MSPRLSHRAAAGLEYSRQLASHEQQLVHIVVDVRLEADLCVILIIAQTEVGRARDYAVDGVGRQRRQHAARIADEDLIARQAAHDAAPVRYVQRVMQWSSQRRDRVQLPCAGDGALEQRSRGAGFGATKSTLGKRPLRSCSMPIAQ